MDKESFLRALSQSIQESAWQARCSAGRQASHATLEQALKQVAMLQAAKKLREEHVSKFSSRYYKDGYETINPGATRGINGRYDVIL